METDNSVLKKKLSAYKSAKGTIKRVPDDLLLVTLRAWEQWPGTAKDFYTSLGMSILIENSSKVVFENSPLFVIFS